MDGVLMSLGGGLLSSQVKWKHWLEVLHSASCTQYGKELGLGAMRMGARISCM